MPDGTSVAGVDLGKIAKPADTLIKKVSDAIGGICAPWQVRRVARAEAEAALIHADAEIQITELKRRALHRFVEEEGRRQENIENITAKALPHLSDDTDASKVDDDWVCTAPGVKGFEDFVRERWKKHLPSKDQGEPAVVGPGA